MTQRQFVGGSLLFVVGSALLMAMLGSESEGAYELLGLLIMITSTWGGILLLRNK